MYINNYINFIFAEGVDFVGPTPLVLVFTDGQTVGDTKCAELTILDDFVPQGERNFSISIGDDAGTAGGDSGGGGGDGRGGGGGGGADGGGDGGRGGGGDGGVRVRSDVPSITISIELDVDDRKCYICVNAVNSNPE